MRSTILMSPGNFHEFQVLTQMATTTQTPSQQRLTFYEDLYLKPRSKSPATLCNRRAFRDAAVKLPNSKKQSLSRHGRQRSCPETSANNPLLDSPPSARLLTLHHEIVKKKQQQSDASNDSNNNDRKDYLKLFETAKVTTSKCTSSLSRPQQIIYENQLFPLHSSPVASNSQETDHLYEVIPAQEPVSPKFQYKNSKCLADESNYLLSSGAHQSSANKCVGKTSPVTEIRHQDTNLKIMRKMGRSADSIRNMQGSKLREQSSTPQTWSKRRHANQFGNSASWDNITEQDFYGQSKGFMTLDKENNCLNINKQMRGRHSKVNQRPASTSAMSPKSSRYDEGVSVKSASSNSIYTPGTMSTSRSSSSSVNSMGRSTNTRNSAVSPHSFGASSPSTVIPTGSINKVKSQPKHQHSASFAGVSSPYENLDGLHKQISQKTQGNSNYVNLPERKKPDTDLNYADLDFTLQQCDRLKKQTSSKNSGSFRPPTLCKTTPTENDDDKVEYTLINIVATQAARLASAEHQRDRESGAHKLSN